MSQIHEIKNELPVKQKTLQIEIALFNKIVQNTNYFYHEKKHLGHNIKQNR